MASDTFLSHTAVDLMFEAIKPLGLLLASLPVGPDHPDITAGASFQLPYRASFQLPYRASFLLPHRRAAWLRFTERLDELVGFADGVRPPRGQTWWGWRRARYGGQPQT